MPKVAGKNGKKVEYVRFTISVPAEIGEWLDGIVRIRNSDRSKIATEIFAERKARSHKKLLR